MPTYKEHLASKLPKVDTNIFTIMSQLSAQHNAINLSQGFPDFDVDKLLVNTLKKYLDKGVHQYAPMQGVLKLRSKYVKKLISYIKQLITKTMKLQLQQELLKQFLRLLLH